MLILILLKNRSAEGSCKNRLFKKKTELANIFQKQLQGNIGSRVNRLRYLLIFWENIAWLISNIELRISNHSVPKGFHSSPLPFSWTSINSSSHYFWLHGCHKKPFLFLPHIILLIYSWEEEVCVRGTLGLLKIKQLPLKVNN